MDRKKLAANALFERVGILKDLSLIGGLHQGSV
jgi:hypothetical protein